MWCRENACCVSCIIKWMRASILYYNVMFACTLLRSYSERKKTLGETWATTIRAINSILWTSVASRCSLTGMGAGPGSICGQKGTMKDVFARCLKRVDVHVCTLTIVYINCSAIAKSTPYYICTFLLLRSTILVPCMYMICDCIITGVYFSQVKSKPWIPWVYTWFWHCREHFVYLGPQ